MVLPSEVSDNEKEHVNWIPNDARTFGILIIHVNSAIKGVADGLASGCQRRLYRRFGINDFITIKEESEVTVSWYHPGVDRMNNNNYCNPLFLKLSFPPVYQWFQLECNIATSFCNIRKR